MAWTLIRSANAQSSNAGEVDITFDSTGADLLVAVVTNQGGVDNVPLQDANNTWVELTKQTSASGAQQAARLFYVVSPVTSASHFVQTTSGSVSLPSIGIQVWSGVRVADPFDSESGANGNGATMQPGSITPTVAGSLFVTGMHGNITVTGTTIDSSFTQTADLAATANAGDLEFAYKIGSGTTAENPLWTAGNNNVRAAVMAVFKPADGVSLSLLWEPHLPTMGGAMTDIIPSGSEPR